MSSKKTVSIPTQLGPTSLVESFGKITFSSEVRELLSALNAEVVVRYNPGAERPIISIMGNDSLNVCSLDEFKALSGYRRFVDDMLKSTERETANQQKAEIVGFFLRKAKTVAGLSLPARMLEQNGSKFMTFGSSIRVVLENLENIDDTVDDKWKTYLVDHGIAIIRILFSAQIKCMGSSLVDKAFVNDELFAAGTPRWLYLKFLDKNFTANVRDQAVTLLFPRNNYLKSIGLTTKEMESEPFLTRNKLVLEKSGGIIALAKADFSALFPHYSKEIKEQVEANLENFMWICTNPYTEAELLAARRSGKHPPLFRESMDSRGSTGRVETEIGRVNREISNTLGKIQSIWNGILNYVIPVANPRTEFWSELFPNAINWEITPMNSIYDCIYNEGNLNPLIGLRAASSANVLKRIGHIVAQGLSVPAGTDDSKAILAIFGSVLNKQSFVEHEEFNETVEINHPTKSLDEMKTHPVSEAEITLAKAFLGYKNRENKSRIKRSGKSSVRPHSSVLNELTPLKGTPLYEPVCDWLTSTFKTGNRKAMQFVAAERILGAAMRNPEEIFLTEIGKDELFEIEEYYEED